MPKRLTFEEIKDRIYEAIAGGATFGKHIKSISGYHGDRYQEAIAQLLQEKKILSKQYTRSVVGYYLPGTRPPTYDTSHTQLPQGEAGRRFAKNDVIVSGAPVVSYKIENGKLPEWDCVKKERSA